MEYNTKTVLITGAARGIGRACAVRFAQEGFRLLLNTRTSTAQLAALQEELFSRFGAVCRISTGDVAEERYVAELFRELDSLGGHLDVLVNNAGISLVGLLQDMSMEEWNRIVSSNLSSVFLCCRSAVPLFLRQGHGSIVNVSSVWGSEGASCETAYSATKGGINAFTKALGKELAPSGIRVNAAAFGAIDTEMNSHLTAEDRRALEEEIPAGRYGTAEEAAELIYDLAVHHSYLTGQIVTMDGGWT